MALSMFTASVPPCLQVIGALGGVLGKAVAHCEAHRVDPAVLLASRLNPTMFPLVRQVQVVTDFARGGCARLAGVAVPSTPDTEASFAELQGRLDATVAFIETVTPGQIDGSEERELAVRIAGREVTFQGQPYLLQFVLPNLYFHAAMAYAILRHNGVVLGKRDFLGSVVGLG